MAAGKSSATSCPGCVASKSGLHASMHHTPSSNPRSTGTTSRAAVSPSSPDTLARPGLLCASSGVHPLLATGGLGIHNPSTMGLGWRKRRERGCTAQNCGRRGPIQLRCHLPCALQAPLSRLEVLPRAAVVLFGPHHGRDGSLSPEGMLRQACLNRLQRILGLGSSLAHVRKGVWERDLPRRPGCHGPGAEEGFG